MSDEKRGRKLSKIGMQTPPKENMRKKTNEREKTKINKKKNYQSRRQSTGDTRGDG